MRFLYKSVSKFCYLVIYVPPKFLFSCDSNVNVNLADPIVKCPQQFFHPFLQLISFVPLSLLLSSQSSLPKGR